MTTTEQIQKLADAYGISKTKAKRILKGSEGMAVRDAALNRIADHPGDTNKVVPPTPTPTPPTPPKRIPPAAPGPKPPVDEPSEGEKLVKAMRAGKKFRIQNVRLLEVNPAGVWIKTTSKREEWLHREEAARRGPILIED